MTSESTVLSSGSTLGNSDATDVTSDSTFVSPESTVFSTDSTFVTSDSTLFSTSSTDSTQGIHEKILAVNFIQFDLKDKNREMCTFRGRVNFKTKKNIPP